MARLGSTMTTPTIANARDRTSTVDLNVAITMARLAEAAYTPFEADNGARLRAELGAAQLELVATFDWDAPPEAIRPRDRRDRGVQAYIASGETMLVVVFRGSSEKADWATNLQSGKRRAQIGERSVLLHAGFWLAYSQIAMSLEAAIATELDRLPRPLIFTGHSLGGALAQIAAAVSTRPEAAACYTFGAPRVSGSWFRRALRVPHYRFVNGWDVVPVAPPILLGYAHTGPSWHLKRNPPKTVLGRGRSMLRTVWINIRSLFGAAFGRDWAGIRDHEMGHYRARIQSLGAAADTSTVAGSRRKAVS